LNLRPKKRDVSLVAIFAQQKSLQKRKIPQPKSCILNYSLHMLLIKFNDCPGRCRTSCYAFLNVVWCLPDGATPSFPLGVAERRMDRVDGCRPCYRFCRIYAPSYGPRGWLPALLWTAWMAAHLRAQRSASSDHFQSKLINRLT